MSRARGIIKPYARYADMRGVVKKLGVCVCSTAREMEMRPKN